MEKEQQVINKVEQHGLLPLFYHDDSSTCIAVMKALYEAGVRCVEFTNRGPLAIHNFKQLVQLRDAEMKGMLLATGTIKTPVQAKQFIDAGADFLISPYFDNAICEEVYQQKMCWIPGCMTPSEIHVAEKAGCKIIKLFPGNILGPGFVEAILPLFSGLDFIVTGGVDTTEHNIESWFKAGVVGVGMGSKLISKDVLQSGNYDSLKEKAKGVVELLRKIKSTLPNLHAEATDDKLNRTCSRREPEKKFSGK